MVSDQPKLACEPCRQRKRKCDRSLPHCSKCDADPSKCIYAEANKRGLPAGYLVALEKRLGETEAALHQALAELYTGCVPENSPVLDITGKAKSAVMDEWQRLPLGNKNDQYYWWTEKSGTLSAQAVEEDDRAVLQNTEPESEDAIQGGVQSKIAPNHHSSAWESSTIQSLENLRQGENVVQPMVEVHQVHPSPSSRGTHQGDASLSSGSQQLHEDRPSQYRPLNAAEGVNMARTYAAIHENIYF